ncbi:hypothetical protein EIN_057120 [Entamoeba invadens IP1]|uniref:hypothetical protein n=1 Tax=Entamoeba invadens IP1 TaxID=370355 RepID=UPI0002C3D800|nr:hypothetical protein EIN_057120 [Entamoeba invadens IP1]ELP93327.1 hypothetical protein EIN_057120 [Entamoeba invadens IP1]|eukprot:XP_004260098.1 hypothetical protein EIN_057120 [Entamoeba invadens IP1]
MRCTSMKKTTLDTYSLMIVSKYFNSPSDYINAMLTSKKHTILFTRFHYNPIEETFLFKKLETQHVYSRSSTLIPHKFQYKVWYSVTYQETYNKVENIEYMNVEYTNTDVRLYGVDIPKCERVRSVALKCFCECNYITSLTLPEGILNISESAFMNCRELQEVVLPDTLISIGKTAFSFCGKLSR